MMKNFYNPFTECTARDITFEEVEKYWCPPYTAFDKVDEQILVNCPTPIFVEGPRGSGKTMLLKHLSYFCQKQLIDKSTISLIDYFSSLGSIAIYFRYKDDFGLLFNSLNCSDAIKSKVFNCYFDLFIAQELLEIIRDLFESIDENLINKSQFFDVISKSINCSVNGYEELDKAIQNKITNVDNWVRNSRYINDSEQIIEKIVGGNRLIDDLCYGVRILIPQWKNILFTIVIDEYENASIYQKELNTLIKQVDEKKKITYRIGVRPSGIITRDTNIGNEFLQEGRDYLICSLNTPKGPTQLKKYKDFIREVANKRLKLVPILNENGFTDIESLLGCKEDLEKEAREIVKNRRDHFSVINQNIPDEEFNTIYELLKNEDNPLLEMLNVLWFCRGNSAKEIYTAMNAYLNGNYDDSKSKAYKYRMDYSNKYKYTLLFILAGIYGVKKSYYSFNTFAYLSSGAINDFISLCRNVFYRLDEDYILNMIEEKKYSIPKKMQTEAAYETALEQINKVKLCKDYGNKMYCFTMNMGRLFRKYHRDQLAKYPETNQFAFYDTSSIQSTPESKKLLENLLKWGVVLRKKNMQSLSIGLKKGEIFYFNKMFSPLFDISYRIRGGYNPVLKTDVFIELSAKDLEADKIEELIRINHTSKNDNIQYSLF